MRVDAFWLVSAWAMSVDDQHDVVIAAAVAPSFQRVDEADARHIAALATRGSAHWLEETYPKIKARAKREKAEIHWEDETGLRSDHQTGRTTILWCSGLVCGSGDRKPRWGRSGPYRRNLIGGNIHTASTGHKPNHGHQRFALLPSRVD